MQLTRQQEGAYVFQMKVKQDDLLWCDLWYDRMLSQPKLTQYQFGVTKLLVFTYFLLHPRDIPSQTLRQLLNTCQVEQHINEGDSKKM